MEYSLKLRRSYLHTLHKQLVLCTFLLISSNSLAQSIASKPSLNSNNKTIQFEPIITEAEIASYYPDKYPVRRWENLQPDISFYQSPYKVSLFSAENGENSHRLLSQTKSIFAYGFGVVGVIALLPGNISNWDKEQSIVNKWPENVVEGPVWDRDKTFLNLIGHPYFGGAYYQVARKSGYRQWDSFLYSTLMSTFYWEYGIESFAEAPSIQDLIITPVLGWVYGEWAFTTEMDIRANNDEVFGSSILGATALILLDPVDSLSVGINNLFGKEIIKAGTGYVAVKNAAIASNGETENQIQFNIYLQLGDGGNYRSNNKSLKMNVNDPINTSIIGISYGVGEVFLDDHWQVTNDFVSEYSLGLYFSKRFSARVVYAKTTLDAILTGDEVAYENYSLDSQYYFNDQSNLRPYITGGFGEMMWQKDHKQTIFQVNLGAGIHYKVSNNIAIQFDWRHYYSRHNESSENTITSRIVYFFAQGEQ